MISLLALVTTGPEHTNQFVAPSGGPTSGIWHPLQRTVAPAGGPLRRPQRPLALTIWARRVIKFETERAQMAA
jgi:hypothetical protein